MKIENLSVSVDGYIKSKSSFYMAQSALEGTYQFISGINEYISDIDSEYWALSYLLSMYRKNKDFILFNELKITVNNNSMQISEFLKLSCYMDELYPMFSTKTNIETLINQGLKKSKTNMTADEVVDAFKLDEERIALPISQVGNMKFRAMAAVGVSFGKEVFCFPWFSEKLFASYHNHLIYTLDVLEKMNKIVVIPKGKVYDTI